MSMDRETSPERPPNATQQPFNPLTEAVGQVILACAGLEAWVYMTLVPDEPQGDDELPHYVRLDREGPEAAIKKLEAAGDPLVPRLRKVFEVRNALAHGAHMGTVDGRLVVAQRPPRGRGVTKATPWVRHSFDRRRLLGIVAKAEHLMGELQGRMIEQANED